jgi:hypothetical protein
VAVLVAVSLSLTQNILFTKLKGMKKLLLCVCVYLITSIASKPVKADETLSLLHVTESKVDNYISRVYKQINFSNCKPLAYEVFSKAMHGYLNLKSAGKLSIDHEMLTVCDFTLSSTQNRMWIINLATKNIVYNTYVAHGNGSGEEFATNFSNTNDSHQSSLGFYITSETYMGEHGLSLRLQGVDNGFNDAAYDRGIVVHGADYVCKKFARTNNYIGRSWGCPAVPVKLSTPIINTIKNGTCLFIYYPDARYIKTAYWLNKKTNHLPDDNMIPDFRTPLPTDTIVEYALAKRVK